MKKLIFALVVAAATAVIVVPLAIAGGNSGNAQACQQGGWQNLVRQDGTGFANQDECVSYGARGGQLLPKPTGGSYNFADAADGSKPLTFPGGTIDPGDYAVADGSTVPNGGAGGSILVSGPYFNGFTTGSGTHFLFTGWGVNSAKLTFTNPVKSVQVEAQNNKSDIVSHLTLTGYDASGNPVSGATSTGTDFGSNSVTLHITSAVANIKYVTISTDDPLLPPTGGTSYGLGFSNIVWS